MSHRILVSGASGQLGSYVLRELVSRSADVVAWSGRLAGTLLGVPLRPIELCDSDRVAAAFREARPEIVIHTAAMASVSDCLRGPAAATAINAGGARLLAELAVASRARFVHVSTDMVFDGEHAPYREEDAPAPLSVYGRTKVEAEQAVLELPYTAVVRVSLLYGPALNGRPTYFDGQRKAIAEGRPLNLFDDEWRTPLDLPTAAKALVEIADAGFEGMLHVGGPERMSRFEMGERFLRSLGGTAKLVAVSRNTGQADPRPRDLSLDSSRWRGLFPRVLWPSYKDALKRILGG